MLRCRTSLVFTLVLTAFLAAGCGDDGGSGGGDGDGDGDGDSAGIDGGPVDGDGVAECSDGLDNDGDGLPDGQDPECTGNLDDDEGSFATGIPGDNRDDKWQDCFFDGNSGAGDDDCRYHTCCLLGSTGGDDCPVDANFDPGSDCPTQTEDCIEYCAPLTPPGCDCFGCCTVCDPETDECYDILTSPAVAPDCTIEDIDDADICPPCTKNAECGGGECEPDGCTLCPGQTEEDLPDECMGQNECPGDNTPCESDTDCTEFEYCSTGCCINNVE